MTQIEVGRKKTIALAVIVIVLMKFSILNYAQKNNLKTKVIFVNDGPGLLLGSMWDDYAMLEKSWQGKIMVLTLRMIPERITIEWLRS